MFAIWTALVLNLIFRAKKENILQALMCNLQIDLYHLAHTPVFSISEIIIKIPQIHTKLTIISVSCKLVNLFQT